MAAGTRLPLALARGLAEDLRDLLRPVCYRLEIAGSIRRERPDVGDIELLAVPMYQARLDLFGDADGEPQDRLVALCDDLLAQGVLKHRLDKNGRQSYGARYKRLVYRDVPLDLFSTTLDMWGLLFLIRTGPAGYSKRLVTARRQGGWLPAAYKVRDGCMWRGDEQVAVQTEQDLYALIGRSYEPPTERTDP